ncbi:MAG: prolipoprotein diacylglyceryl transferase [Burkholderiales bacterium]|nr:prolipoprotein diacylglyceryl transferase [Burkholderiales bacterium]
MLIHPQFNPVALSLGPLSVHWYGISYLLAFVLFLVLAKRRLAHQPYAQWAVLGQWGQKDIDNLMTYGVLGVILGGRLGYCLFYKLSYYSQHPLEVLYIWQGGMSFHGGMLGVIAALALFAWQGQRQWLQITDFVAPCVPTGLASGRVGNFINGELWGRAADPSLPWAMVFPQSGSLLPRHPSQIYQFLLEGLLLFALLWWQARRPQPTGWISGLFLSGYGLTRFIAEYFREPDAHLGLLALGLSMGQWLCVPMLLLGVVMMLWAKRRVAT